MKNFLMAYTGALAAFLILDGIWLSLVAGGFYAETIGYLMRENIIWVSAIIFYLLYIGGVVHFVSLPAARENKLKKAALNGAFLGIIAYGTYDLTNYATIRDWPFVVVAVDMAWGAFVTTMVGIAGFFAARKAVPATV